MSHRITSAFCRIFVVVLLCGVLQGCVFLPENSEPVSFITGSTVVTTLTTTTTTTTSTTTTTASSTTASSTTKSSTTTPTKQRNTTSRTTSTAMPSTAADKTILPVPVIAQFPDFPTGCESVSAVMALRYYGYSLTVDEFVDKYLQKDNRFWWKNGVLHGPDPYRYFVGDPTTENSYGCMAPVIEKALTTYFGSDERVVNTTGASLSSLCSDYIDKGIPVLIWATIGMIETGAGQSWELDDGSTFTWPKNEHCMVLIGYDDTRYYFNDPYRGMVKSYSRSLCEARYKDLGKQSIAVTK